jgi:hypothetical protein
MKRILAIDGGGIRGVFALQILERIEGIFREEYQRPDLVLADVFDMFAGTSTGAIIATGLAWGKSAGEIGAMYVKFGPQMFCRERWFHRYKCKYRVEGLRKFFQDQLSEDGQGKEAALLGSGRLRAKLLMVMRNATTGKTWVITNHPDAVYNDPKRKESDLKLPLWQLLLATTAAPTFFPPEKIRVGEKEFLFVDGGVTPFANPALVAVLHATLPQYRMCWPTGRDALHVISVGTGMFHVRLPPKEAGRINVLDQMRFVIPTIVSTTSIEQDVACRIMGDCVYGHAIDAIMGQMQAPSLFGAGEQKFTYVRYDKALDTPELVVTRPLRSEMDNLKLIPSLAGLGREYAAEHVKWEHLWPRGCNGVERKKEIAAEAATPVKAF